MAILGQNQSCSSSLRYMARRVLYPIFGCPYMHLLSQLTSNFHERRYYGWQNSRWGDRWWNSAENTENMSEKHQAYTTTIIHRTFPCVFRKLVWLKAVQLPLDRWRQLTRRTTGELLSAWNSDLFMHIFTRVLSLQRRKPLTRAFHADPPWTNLHSCNQTRLHNGDS